MLAKSCPKVSLQSRLSRESYDAKFGMDECALNNYGVTLNQLLKLKSKTNKIQKKLTVFFYLLFFCYFSVPSTLDKIGCE